jgi:hypothetical protein
VTTRWHLWLKFHHLWGYVYMFVFPFKFIYSLLVVLPFCCWIHTLFYLLFYFSALEFPFSFSLYFLFLFWELLSIFPTPIFKYLHYCLVKFCDCFQHIPI